MRKLVFVTTVLTAAMLAHAAHAYIGPGAGIGAVGAVVGVLVAVLAAVAIVLSWPVRLMIRKVRGPAPPSASGGGDVEERREHDAKAPPRPMT